MTVGLRPYLLVGESMVLITEDPLKQVLRLRRHLLTRIWYVQESSKIHNLSKNTVTAISGGGIPSALSYPASYESPRRARLP